MKKLLIFSSTLLLATSINVYANLAKPISNLVTEYTYIGSVYGDDGARNAAFDDDGLIPLTENELRSLERASQSRSTTTPTGGTLTSNVWMSRPRGTMGEFEYQVSAEYNRSDHTNIRTSWFGQANANTGANFGIGLSSVSFGSNNQTRATSRRSWENTQGQGDASFRTNGFIQGRWNWVSIENQAQVWGGSLGSKPTEISARAGY